MGNQQGQSPQWPPPSGQPPNWYPLNQGWVSPQHPPRGQQPSRQPYQPNQPSQPQWQQNTQYLQWSQPRPGYPPYRLSSKRSPRRLYLAIAFFSIVGLLFIISLLWSLFPSQTQGFILSLEPSCTIGFSGTSVTFTIQGWTAPQDCADMVAGRPNFFGGSGSSSGGTVYQVTQTPTQPIVCELDYQGRHVIVREAGTLLGTLVCKGLQEKQTNNSGVTTTTTQQSSSAQQSSNNVISKPVVANDTWTVTLNSVTMSHGNNMFDVPKAGNTFLVFNVTLHNTSSQNQSTSSLAMFALKDSTGQTYGQDIIYGGSPDGTVAAGDVIRGDIAYQVPQSIKTFTFQFKPDLIATDLVQWNVQAK